MEEEFAPFGSAVAEPPPPSLGLDEAPAGSFLAAAVSTVRRSELEPEQLVELLKAEVRLASHFQSQAARTMVELTREADHEEFAHLEVGVPLRLTRRASQARVDMAWALVERLPRVLEMLDEGLIDWARARAMVNGTTHLDEDSAREVIDRIADDAPSLTTGQIGARLGRLAIEVDPAAAELRQESAVEDRRVVAEPLPDGTGELVGIGLPPDRVSAAMSHLNRTARALRRAGDSRTMDQLRADVFLDLLSGLCHHGEKPAVADISLDLQTAMGLADRPGEIPGWGPVLADIARKVLAESADGEWRFHVTDPDTHEVLTTVTTRRRPTAAQERAVEARHPRCTFPGCRMPARSSDIDHRNAYAAGGPTHTSNLHPLCRFHHRAKDEGGWKDLRVGEGDGPWASPLGVVHKIRRRAP